MQRNKNEKRDERGEREGEILRRDWELKMSQTKKNPPDELSHNDSKKKKTFGRIIRSKSYLNLIFRPARINSEFISGRAAVSLPKLVKSAWQPGSCQSLSTAGSTTGCETPCHVSTLHAHRLLCKNLQQLCCSHSLNLFSLSRLPAQFPLIVTCYTHTPSTHFQGQITKVVLGRRHWWRPVACPTTLSQQNCEGTGPGHHQHVQHNKCSQIHTPTRIFQRCCCSCSSTHIHLTHCAHFRLFMVHGRTEKSFHQVIILLTCLTGVRRLPLPHPRPVTLVPCLSLTLFCMFTPTMSGSMTLHHSNTGYGYERKGFSNSEFHNGRWRHKILTCPTSPCTLPRVQIFRQPILHK